MDKFTAIRGWKHEDYGVKIFLDSHKNSEEYKCPDVTACKTLVANVLWRAAKDMSIKKRHKAANPLYIDKTKTEYKSAYMWVHDTSTKEWSFLWCLDQLDIYPETFWKVVQHELNLYNIKGKQ